MKAKCTTFSFTSARDGLGDLEVQRVDAKRFYHKEKTFYSFLYL